MTKHDEEAARRIAEELVEHEIKLVERLLRHRARLYIDFIVEQVAKGMEKKP